MAINLLMEPRAVYMWKDRSSKIHLLKCNDVCECRQELDSILASDVAFLLLMITDDGTHLASCPKVPELCSCDMYVYTNYVKISDTIHYAGCTARNCSCKKELPTNIFYIPEAMPPRGTLWEKRNILHVANCIGKTPCVCTYMLFSCGYYKVRLSIHGPHLTKCALSVDYGTNPSEPCNCDTILREQSRWARQGTDYVTETDNLTTAFGRLYKHIDDMSETNLTTAFSRLYTDQKDRSQKLVI